MSFLVAGLLLFLGTHLIRVFATSWRSEQIARMGPRAWRGLYSAFALLGFALIIWGYGEARLMPTVLWVPPVWTRHLAALLTLPAFILLVAAYVPGSRIKAAIGHPMVAGTKLWALSHLLANGNLADVLLFGGFLAWAVVVFAAARRRDREAGVRYPVGPPSRDAIVAIGGIVAWAVFARFLHGPLIGVQPF